MSTELDRVGGLSPRPIDTIDALQAAVLAFDSQRAELAAAGDIDALAVGMIRLRELQKSFRILLDAVEQDVAGLMEKAVVTLEGIGTLQRQRSATKTEWDDRGLAKDLVAKAMEAGVVHHPLDVVDLLLKAGHVDYWRLGEAKKVGVDGKEFRTQTLGRLKVSVTGDGPDV